MQLAPPARFLTRNCQNNNHRNCNIDLCPHPCCRSINPAYAAYERTVAHHAVFGAHHASGDAVPFHHSTNQKETAIWIRLVVETAGNDFHLSVQLVQAKCRVSSIKARAAELLRNHDNIPRDAFAEFCTQSLNDGDEAWLTELLDGVRHPDDQTPTESIADLDQRLHTMKKTYIFFHELCSSEPLPTDLDAAYTAGLLDVIDEDWRNTIQFQSKASNGQTPITFEYIIKLAKALEKQAKATHKLRRANNKRKRLRPAVSDSSDDDTTTVASATMEDRLAAMQTTIESLKVPKPEPADIPVNAARPQSEQTPLSRPPGTHEYMPRGCYVCGENDHWAAACPHRPANFKPLSPPPARQRDQPTSTNGSDQRELVLLRELARLTANQHPSVDGDTGPKHRNYPRTKRKQRERSAPNRKEDDGDRDRDRDRDRGYDRERPREKDDDRDRYRDADRSRRPKNSERRMGNDRRA
jgi:hypothetical protein